MKNLDLRVHADISQAHTLPSSFYRNPALFEQSKDSIFARFWQCIGLESTLAESGSAQPFQLLDGFLNEPLVLVRDEAAKLRCLSNVCTHRANLVVTEGGSCKELRCRYHGRRWALDGSFKSMPEFKEAKDFPGECDHLPETPLHRLGDLLFTSLDPTCKFEEWIGPVLERVGWMPLREFQHAIDYSQSYEVEAHWAIYCDNYLEGFHIPFVHPGLNENLSYPDYSYQTFKYCNLQTGIAKEGTPSFDLPKDHPDNGKKVAAWFFWLFPNIMLNFYPWGLSLNLVEPLGMNHTRIRFETFIWDESKYNSQSQDLIHLTEMEDEAIVASVHKGLQSRLYKKGRFSPRMEVAVHHFHQLLAQSMNM